MSNITQREPVAGRAIEDPDVLNAWALACDFWDSSVSLRAPVALSGEDIAFINLGNRQTHINTSKLREMGLGDQIVCVLTHEVGHHIRFPHTLLALRRQQLFVRNHFGALIDARGVQPLPARTSEEGAYDYLQNVLSDILINDHIVRHDSAGTFLDDFVLLYQKLVTSSDRTETDMAFTMSVYEAMWYLPESTLVTADQAEALTAVRAQWRDDARDLAARIEAADGDQLRQLAEFLVTISYYIPPQHDGPKPQALDGVGGKLSPAAARRLSDINGRNRAAGGVIERALPRSKRDAPPGSPNQSDGFPGTAIVDFVPDINDAAASWYRRKSQAAQIDPPRSQRREPDTVPGAPTHWEVGEELGKIDWFATLSRSGVAIPGVTTLQRTWLPDEPTPGEKQSPWLEIYVDSSGSMPDPTKTMNPQVLAAFALVRAATEAGGRVRVIQFSAAGQFIAMPSFVSSPRPAEMALVQYIGGGTMFPFAELDRSVARTRGQARVVRVLFSDADFLNNVSHPYPRGAITAAITTASLRRACEDKDRFVAVLVLPTSPLFRKEHFSDIEMIMLRSRDDLLAAARELSTVLYPPEAEA